MFFDHDKIDCQVITCTARQTSETSRPKSMATSFCAGKRFLHILLGQYIMRLNGKLGQDVLKNIIHDIKISSKFRNILKGAG